MGILSKAMAGAAGTLKEGLMQQHMSNIRKSEAQERDAVVDQRYEARAALDAERDKILMDQKQTMMNARSKGLTSLGASLGPEDQETFKAMAEADPSGKSAIGFAKSILGPSNPLVSIDNGDKAGMTEEQKALAKVRVGRFDVMKKSANDAISQNEQLKQLSEIDINTGFGESLKTETARVFNAFGVDGDSLLGVDAANSQSFNALSGKLLAEVLASQKGPQTDKDAERMMAVLPQLKNEGDANKFILSSMRAVNDRKIEQANFYERELEANGSLRGADRKWRKHIESTPIMSSSQVDINTGRPMFFNDFAEMAKESNPNASMEDISTSWRGLNE